MFKTVLLFVLIGSFFFSVSLMTFSGVVPRSHHSHELCGFYWAILHRAGIFRNICYTTAELTVVSRELKFHFLCGTQTFIFILVISFRGLNSH